MGTWEILRILAEDAGIEEEFQAFQDSLPNRFIDAITTATGTRARYLQDPLFHSRLDHLVGIVVLALIESNNRTTLTSKDMAALTKIFEQEVWGEAGKR